MEEMKSFILWCLEQIPDFLLTPPISAFTGILFLFFTVELVRRIMHISR